MTSTVTTLFGDPILEAEIASDVKDPIRLAAMRDQIYISAIYWHTKRLTHFEETPSGGVQNRSDSYPIGKNYYRIETREQFSIPFLRSELNFAITDTDDRPNISFKELEALVRDTVNGQVSNMTFFYTGVDETSSLEAKAEREEYADFYSYLLHLGFNDIKSLPIDIFNVGENKLDFIGLHTPNQSIAVITKNNNPFTNLHTLAHEAAHGIFDSRKDDPEFAKKVMELYSACLFGEATSHVYYEYKDLCASLPSQYSSLNPNELHSEVFAFSVTGIFAAKAIQHLVETNDYEKLLKVDFTSDYFWIFNQPEHIRGQVAELCNLNLNLIEELRSLVSTTQQSLITGNHRFQKLKKAISANADISFYATCGSIAAVGGNLVNQIILKEGLAATYPLLKPIIELGSIRNLFLLGAATASLNFLSHSKTALKNLYNKANSRPNGTVSLLKSVKSQISGSYALQRSHKVDKPGQLKI